MAMLGHYLKIWADKWSASGETKGGKISLRHDKFFITSNYVPADLWPEDQMLCKAIERRFEFIEMREVYADACKPIARDVEDAANELIDLTNAPLFAAMSNQ